MNTTRLSQAAQLRAYEQAQGIVGAAFDPLATLRARLADCERRLGIWTDQRARAIARIGGDSDDARHTLDRVDDELRHVTRERRRLERAIAHEEAR